MSKRGLGWVGESFSRACFCSQASLTVPRTHPPAPPPNTHAAAAACEQNWSEELLSDGLHLTPAGQAKAYVDLQTLINENYPQLQ